MMHSSIARAVKALVAETGLSDFNVSVGVKAILEGLPKDEVVLKQTALALREEIYYSGGRAYIISNAVCNLELRSELLNPQYPYSHLLP